jgi:pantoate--beta-alanine ligase
VVTKLFGIVRPHLALFGRKDYQQAAVVRQLIADLNLAVELDVRPTVRERDGLAMSSRNAYLSPDQRRRAPILYHALSAGRQAILGGVRDGAKVDQIMKRVISREPDVQVEYLAACHMTSLEPLSRVDLSAVLLGAVRIGLVRLIDNVVVTRRTPTRR